jgi:hypothetical protein
MSGAAPVLRFIRQPVAPRSQSDHERRTAAAAEVTVVIGRLIIPIPEAQSLAAGHYDFLKQRGFDPAPKPADPKRLTFPADNQEVTL